MKTSITLLLAGTAVARTLDLPTVKNALTTFTSGVQKVDQTIIQIDASNVGKQVDLIASQIRQLGNQNKATITALKQSKALRINDLQPLIATAKEAAPVFQKTAADLLAKRELINSVNGADKLNAAFHDVVPVIVGIVEAAPGQLPALAKGLIPAGTIPSSADLTPKLNKGLDDFFAKFKGTEPIVLPDLAALSSNVGKTGGLGKSAGTASAPNAKTASSRPKSPRVGKAN